MILPQAVRITIPPRIFLFVAGVYFVICCSLSQLSRWLERRWGWGEGAGHA